MLAGGATSPFDFSNAPATEKKASAGSATESALGGIIEQVSAEMLPSIPQPGDSVSIRVTSYSTDLGKASIAWLRDGQVVAEGIGLRLFSFTAPEAGQQTKIEMVAQKEGGGTVRKSFTVTPADLDLIYEVQTYAPVLYEGRTEFTNSSTVRLVAMPDFVDPTTGLRVPPEELVYTWRIDGAVDQEASGYGRQTAETTGKLISRGIEVELVVEAIKSPLKARVFATIQDQRPEVVMYEDHPTYGVIFEHALGTDPYPVRESEISLVAIPYSMDIFSLSDPRVKFSWSTIGGRGEGPTAIFANERGEEGVFPVRARVTHQNFAQYADGAGNIEIFRAATGTASSSF
jgi:hypothetical protein